jgi:hypothetical protein
MDEYTDKQTGMRLTVEREHPYDPDWPHITVYPPEQNMLTTEEMNEAVKRLIRMAGYDEVIKKWVNKP